MKVVVTIALFTILTSCSSFDKKKDNSEKEGVVKNFRPDGTLYSEASYHNEKLHGVSKTYHPNGKLFLEESYVNGTKHGKTIQYYQTGILYSETNYDSGKIHGIVKRYHKDGKLKAEAPYNHGCECLGLKEYILNGNPRPHYPEIVIRTEDKMLTQASYYIHLSLTERVKKVEYFRGYLKEGCLHNELEPIMSTGEDRGRIGYTIGPGEFVMEKINVIARIETITGNVLVTQKSFNVAADFPPF